MSKKVQYRAMRLLWHSKEERYIQPGELVNLDHLFPDVIQKLQDMAAVDAVPEIKVLKVAETSAKDEE